MRASRSSILCRWGGRSIAPPRRLGRRTAPYRPSEARLPPRRCRRSVRETADPRALGLRARSLGPALGHHSSPPSTSRYNVRIGSFAINLVGGGIRNCANSVDPPACYAEPFIRYSLKHVGPAWVTDYDQAWRSLNIPKAFVEDGKALSTEEWLDPVSTASTAPMSAT